MELISLTTSPSDSRRASLLKAGSVVVHGLVVIALFTFQLHSSAKLRKPKHITAAVIVPYAPGHQSAAVTPPKPKITPPKDPPKLTMNEPPPPPPASAGDPTGESDVSVALADFFPDPKPDLSALPHGTRGDIVLDIVIDEDGKVVEADIDQGLGHGVDEAVAAVIQTWTFTPATRAGKPVASKQQLLFHFERA